MSKLDMSNYTSFDIDDFNKTAEHQAAAEPYPIPVAVLLGGVTTMAVILNLGVLVIFLKSNTVRDNRHHSLVLLLSISDVTGGLGGILSCIRLIITSWSEITLPCIISTGLTFVGLISSLFQTFIISFHRLLVSADSRWNNRLLQGKRKYIIYFIGWSGALILTFACVSPAPRSDKAFCVVMHVYGENFPIFAFVVGVLDMVLLLSTIFLYGFTLHNVRKRYMRMYA
jgi:hypothetical protein